MIQAHVPLRIVQFVVISNVWSTFVNFSLVEFEAIFFCCYLPAIFSQTLNADSKIRSPKKETANEINFRNVRSDVVVFSMLTETFFIYFLSFLRLVYGFKASPQFHFVNFVN